MIHPSVATATSCPKAECDAPLASRSEGPGGYVAVVCTRRHICLTPAPEEGTDARVDWYVSLLRDTVVA